MSIKTDDAWRPLTACADVRVLKYSWGPGTANALAVRLADGSWLIVSPPPQPSPGVLEELAQDGGVSALLAPNAYHYLGQTAWRQRFPGAGSWAPSGAHERIAKKAHGMPLGKAEQLLSELADNAELIFPDGQKSPDSLLRFTSDSGEVVWWLGDLFSNTTPADQIWPLRVLSRLAGGGPGFRRNSKPELVYVRNRTAWLTSVRRAVALHPPSVVVPAHGEAVTTDAAKRTEKVLDD